MSQDYSCVGSKFICVDPCDEESFRSLHMYYLIGASCTLCGSLFVILTYLFSPTLRTHPSVLLFGRSIFDFGFGLSFVTLYVFAKNNLSDLICVDLVCGVMGPFNLFVFLCSQGYFLSLLIDLYLSISNPFLNDISYTNMMHLFIILTATISVSIVKIFWGFSYNDDLQYCTIAPTDEDKAFNLFNWCFIFGPTLFCMIFSCFVTFYAFSRLTKGLPNSFFVRIKALKDTFMYSVIFTIYFFIVGLCYFITWERRIDPQHDTLWYRFYAISSSLLGAMDCIVWVSRKCNSINKVYFNEFEFLSSKHDQTAIDIKHPNKSQGLSVKHQHQRSDSSASSHTLELLQNSEINDTKSVKMRESKSQFEPPTHSKSRSRFSSNKTKSSLQPALPHTVFNELATETDNESDDDAASKIKKQSVSRMQCCKRLFSRFGVKQQSNSAMINKALRREVVAYTTDGIAQSVGKAAKLPTKIDRFEDIKEFYYPLHMHDHNVMAIKQFKIGIRHNITLLNTANNYGDKINMRFCCCFRMDNNEISISLSHPRADSIIHDSNIVTENSNLLSSTYKSRGNRKKARLFTDYAPLIFAYIRQKILCISDDDYISSIIPTNEEDQLKVLDVKYGEGKSGAFFYFTWDSRFIVKTVSKKEVKYLLSFLPSYVSHLQHNRNTTISRIVGIHSCKFYNIVKHFIVMENVFIGELKPNEIYDLKGSWEGRYTKHGVHSGKVMKDLDLKRYIILNKKERMKIIKQLEIDTQFLCENNIMDYSMLLGIYYMKITYKDRYNKSYDDNDEDELKYGQYLEHEGDIYGGVRASLIEGPGIYYFGIIDALQKYTFRKRLETCFRRWIQRKSVKGISCVDAVLYKKRFMKYMKSIIISDDKYYRQLNLSTNRFGDENVLIYPPRKLLYHNMQIMRQKRTMSMAPVVCAHNEHNDRIVRISAFDQTVMDNTIYSENEEDGMDEEHVAITKVEEQILNDIIDIRLSKSKSQVAKQNKYKTK